MFSTLGIKPEQVYGDVYASWLRDTFEKNSDETKQIFRDIVEAGFLDRQVLLRRQRLGVNVVTSLATALHRSPLTRLDLHGNALRDIGCDVIAHLMSDLPNLTYLDLGANGITGSGARSLGLAVAQHSKLAVLILSSRPAEDPYANALTSRSSGTAVLLHGCLRSRSLRHLDLSGNPLGDDSVSDTMTSGDGLDGGGESHSGAKKKSEKDPLEGITTTSPMDADGGEQDEKDGADTGNDYQSPIDIISQILTRPSGGSLTSLKLSNVNLSTRNACRLISAIRGNSTLTVLDLSENRLSSVVGDALGQLLQDRISMHNTCGLTALYLSGNPIFADSTAKSDGGTPDAFGRKLFSALAASGNKSSSAAAAAAGDMNSFSSAPFVTSAAMNTTLPLSAPSLLLTSLANDRMLTTLELDRCGVDSVAVHGLCRALSSNGALRNLSLKDNAINADGAVDLGRALCRHPCLERLNLAGNAIEDEGACALAAVIEGEKGQFAAPASALDGSAGPLSLSHSHGAQTPGPSVSFSPETLSPRKGTRDGRRHGGDGAAQAGEPASTLARLDLQRTSLGDRGLVALGVALQGNTTLRALHLGGNHFTSDGGESFAALLEKNRSVVRCELGATSVPCPTILRLHRCIARNRERRQNAEGDALRREVVRLHFQKYKLEEARNELEGLHDRNAATKVTADNYDLQFKQEQSDYTKKIRELEEQAENYIAQAQRYTQQTDQLEAELKKAALAFDEDANAAKQRVEAELHHREQVEAEHRQLEAELEEWKNNPQGREQARRERIAGLRAEMDRWAGQTKQYRQETAQLAQEVKELEAKAAAAAGGGKKKKAKP